LFFPSFLPLLRRPAWYSPRDQKRSPWLTEAAQTSTASHGALSREEILTYLLEEGASASHADGFMAELGVGFAGGGEIDLRSTLPGSAPPLSASRPLCCVLSEAR